MRNDEYTVAEMKMNWARSPRWAGILRPYQAEDVMRLRGSFKIE